MKVNDHRPEWARWLYIRLMTVRQRRMFAIYAAEQVLPIWEKKHPANLAPRKAIEAAHAAIRRNTQKNRDLARDAAKAAYVAYATYAAYPNSAYARAANSAYAAASTSVYTYTYVDDAAYAAAHASAAIATYHRKKMQRRLIKEAVRILDAGLKTKKTKKGTK